MAMTDSKVPSSRAHRILVVDDSKDAANSMAMLLRLSGHYVQVAFDGASALSLANEQKPEIILLDLGLPRMDGYSVIQVLRERPATSDALVIAVTGYGQTSDRDHTTEAGFDLHLVKPVDAKQLMAFLSGEPNSLIEDERGSDGGTGRIQEFTKGERANSQPS